MSVIKYLKKSEAARALVVSQRVIIPSLSRCLIYEFEDLIHQFDSVDIVVPNTSQMPNWLQHKFRRVVQRMGGSGYFLEQDAPYVDKKYDLLLVTGESLGDLYPLGSLRRWLKTSCVSVCYLQEVWAKDIPLRTGEIALLRQFDLIFVSCQSSVSKLAQATGRPCAYLAPGVDAIAFCPYPNPPSRVIDFYNMGRRAPMTHEALINLAQDRDFFYMYDTITGNVTNDVADHRRLLAQMIKRTRYFLVNNPKSNVPNQTGGQQEVGTRFFEGTAGGVVMIGQAPQCPAFEELFGWPDAVVPLPYDSADIADVINELNSDSNRVDCIRKTNIAQALRRHDWVYRWIEILKAASLKPMPGCTARKVRLEELADLVMAAPPCCSTRAIPMRLQEPTRSP